MTLHSPANRIVAFAPAQARDGTKHSGRFWGGAISILLAILLAILFPHRMPSFRIQRCLRTV